MVGVKGSFSILALAAGLAGCAAPRAGADPLTSNCPVRWIIVETAAAEIPSRGRWPSGGMTPDSHVLAMAAVPEDGMTWVPEIHAPDYFVEVLKVDPEGPVAVGQVVTLTVRVGNAKPDAKYRLIAGSTSSEIRVLGRKELNVWGKGPASFSFTNLEDGFGGISISVQAIK